MASTDSARVNREKGTDRNHPIGDCSLFLLSGLERRHAFYVLTHQLLNRVRFRSLLAARRRKGPTFGAHYHLRTAPVEDSMPSTLQPRALTRRGPGHTQRRRTNWCRPKIQGSWGRWINPMFPRPCAGGVDPEPCGDNLDRASITNSSWSSAPLGFTDEQVNRGQLVLAIGGG